MKTMSKTLRNLSKAALFFVGAGSFASNNKNSIDLLGVGSAVQGVGEAINGGCQVWSSHIDATANKECAKTLANAAKECAEVAAKAVENCTDKACNTIIEGLKLEKEIAKINLQAADINLQAADTNLKAAEVNFRAAETSSLNDRFEAKLEGIGEALVVVAVVVVVIIVVAVVAYLAYDYYTRDKQTAQPAG